MSASRLHWRSHKLIPEDVKMRYHLSVLALLLVAGVGHGAEQAPPPREKKVYYFPVTVGSKWVYTWQCGIEGDKID
jgi:hypothetical protein